MTAKEIMFGDAARQSMTNGVGILARAVKATLGLKGRNVIINKSYTEPVMIKDGVSVAKVIQLEDAFENKGDVIDVHPNTSIIKRIKKQSRNNT